MINLIPNKDKKQMAKGFYFRLIVLFLVMGIMSILIAFVAILPAYFFSSVRSNLVDAKLEAQQREPVPLPDQETLGIIKDVDKKLSIIEKAESEKFVVTLSVINAIILKKLPEIKITDISYQKDPKNPSSKGQISIQGTAPSRETLLLFRRALEDDVNFKSVNLPISNFVKGSNILFSLSLVPRSNDDSVGQASQ
jgi:hypothetical protein